MGRSPGSGWGPENLLAPELAFPFLSSLSSHWHGGGRGQRLMASESPGLGRFLPGTASAGEPSASSSCLDGAGTCAPKALPALRWYCLDKEEGDLLTLGLQEQGRVRGPAGNHHGPLHRH